MASIYPANILTFKAAAAIAKGKVVIAGADDDHVAVSTVATAKNIGILQTATTEAEGKAEVALPGGGGKALLGSGGAAFGDLLTSDSNGALVVTTTPGNRVMAMALQAGSENDLISVMVLAQLI